MAKVTRKDFRELTVSETTNYSRRTNPMLTPELMDEYVERIEVHPDNEIRVICKSIL